MTWVRIESGFFRHRKVLDLSHAAKLLFLGSLCYAAENGTDGHISTSALRILTAELCVKQAIHTELLDAGLWHKQAGGHDIHDYLVYQPSADQERQRRAENADRTKAWRDRKQSSRDTARDASHNKARDGGGDGVRVSSPNPNPSITSSSSSDSRPARPPVGEEEDFAMAEAKRRLNARQGAPVTNPEAWVRTTAAGLRLEHYAATSAPPTIHPANHQRPDCATCDGLALVEVDGAYVPCEECK